MKFSDNVNLNVETPVRELSDVKGYTIQALAAEWENSYHEAKNTSDRSIAKLVRWLEDKYDEKNLEHGSRIWRRLCSFMSEDLANIDQYGMTPIMLKDL